MTLQVHRDPTVLRPDQTRVILLPFTPGDSRRIGGIIARIMALGEESVVTLLAEIIENFRGRHGDLSGRFLERFDQVRQMLDTDEFISEPRRLLIGSYFLNEYSVESAALFNPSIVPDINQAGLPEGALRFILSLRATGEGHISSITFRSGIVFADGRIEIQTPAGTLLEPRQIQDPEHTNEEVRFEPGHAMSQRVIFPFMPSQSNGIEDARFVRFQPAQGEACYYATFTAYDGRVIAPQLLETSDFLSFRFISLNGEAAVNKGMALFPRKIDGRFAMISRQDNESIFIMYSDNVTFWNERIPLLKPVFPWELIQIGNCGSPIETEAGWLVLSHGVGAMREYSIGAFLLDLNEPSRVIGRLAEPLLHPSPSEREGYVPNVVYSCGSLVHNKKLVIAYGLADHATGFATVPLADVLAAMQPV